MAKLKYNKEGECTVVNSEAVGEQVYQLVSGYDVRDIADIKIFEGRLLRADWNAKSGCIWVFDTPEGEVGLWTCLDMDKAFFPMLERTVEHDVRVKIEFVEKIEIAGGKTFKRIRVFLDPGSSAELKAIQKEQRQQELPLDAK